MLDHPHNDFLRPSNAQPTSPPTNDLTETNRILRRLLAELRKDLPKQRCVIEIEGGAIVNGVNTCSLNADPVNVSFLNMGNKVKSFYTIVSNGSDVTASVSLNEPNLGSASIGTTTQNGLFLGGFASSKSPWAILIDVEIQFISLVAAGANAIPVNAPSQGHGSIWVYAWTLPEYANITE